MSRQKQEVTKNVEIRVRIEPELKEQYFLFCKKNKQILSKRIRELILNDLKND